MPAVLIFDLFIMTNNADNFILDLQNITPDQREFVYKKLRAWLDEVSGNMADIQLVNITEEVDEIHDIIGMLDYDEQRAMLMYFFLLTFSSEFIQEQIENKDIKSLDDYRKFYRYNPDGGWVH